MRTQRKRRSALSPVGLDIGHTGVRAAQLTRSGDGWVVARTARIKNGTDGKDDAASDGRLKFGIQACMASAPFRGRRVIVGLVPPDVDFHALQLPEAIITKPPAELQTVVCAEVQRLVSKPEDRFQAGHWCLPANRVTGPNVLSAVASEAVIERTLKACDVAGLDCCVMDTSATALVRMASLLWKQAPDSLWGVLDLGSRQTRLVLSLEDSPVLTRTAGSGASAWTTRIAESLGISVAAAEIHKCDHGINHARRPRTAQGKQHEEADLGSMIFGILRSDLNALAAEIKRSYEYVLSCYPQKQAGHLVLTGGGARMRGLSEFLAGELGIPVTAGFERLSVGTGSISFGSQEPKEPEELMLAIGLALGAM